MTEGYSFLSTTKVGASVQAEKQEVPIEKDDSFTAVVDRRGKKTGRIKIPVQEPPRPITYDKKKKKKEKKNTE